MEKEITNAAETSSAAFFALVRHPVKFRLFLLSNLPSAYFSGLRVKDISDEKASITIPFKWFTKNPFRSTYFACLGMAAEMSTGILAMANIYKRKPSVAMLITSIEGKFIKKATGTTIFTCADGLKIKETVKEAIETNQPVQVEALSTGRNEQGEIVAEFLCVWSFKPRSKDRN